MRRESWAKYLEISTNIAVLLVAVALLAALISARFAVPGKTTFERGLHKGQAMPKLLGIDYSAAPRTLLLSLSTKCHYCEESLPFYKRLIDEQHRSAEKLSLFALFPNSETEVKDYQKRNQLDLKYVANVHPSSIDVAGTPTLVLVDAEGKVSDVWVGKLSSADEQEVMGIFQTR